MQPLQDLKITEITTTATTIDWHLGNHCQYSCTYCPAYLHANNTQHLDLEQMKELAIAAEERLQFQTISKRIMFTFSGGEPTLNPRFGPYVQWLKERGHIINIVTNGGRTLRWWQEWGHNFNLVVFSFHSEFTDLDHFYKIVEYQTSLDSGRTEVHLITWADKFDRIVEAQNKLSAIKECKVITKKITEDWFSPGVKMTPYTNDQLAWIDSNVITGSNTSKNSIGPNFRVMGEVNGEKKIVQIHPLVLRNHNLNKFRGWKCKQGIKNLSIDVYGRVWGAHCRQLLLGTVADVSNIKWPTEASICKTNVCHCSGDTMIDKSIE